MSTPQHVKGGVLTVLSTSRSDITCATWLRYSLRHTTQPWITEDTPDVQLSTQRNSIILEENLRFPSSNHNNNEQCQLTVLEIRPYLSIVVEYSKSHLPDKSH